MPRITQTANDHDYSGKPLRYAGAILGTRVSRDFRADLAEAVYSDHPCDDVTSCDISAALEEGFVYASAYLLYGATECPALDKCIAAHRFNGTLPDSFDMRVMGWEDASISTCTTDWDGWCAYHDEHGVKCSSCGSYNYDPAPGETCDNCLAKLPFRPLKRRHWDSSCWQDLGELTADNIGESLTSNVWPGGYPVVYIDPEDESEGLCAETVREMVEAGEWDSDVVSSYTHYEGSAVECSCGKIIESAYGETEIDE